MISNENILKLEIRKRIYNLVSEQPGLHLRELERKMNISFGSLRYHLNYLEKQGLIITKTDHRYTGYYVSREVSQKDKEMFNLLRQEIPRKIIMLMFCPWTGDRWKSKEIYKNKKRYLEEGRKATKDPTNYPRAFSKTELIELARYWRGDKAKLFHLNKHPTTLDFHLEKLLAADLIEKVRVKKEIKYKLKDKEKIFNFIILNNYELSKEDVNIWLLWTGMFSPKNIEKIMETLYDILPHPYHL
jgi:DNA-binding transcriptional ArsR family regulator